MGSDVVMHLLLGLVVVLQPPAPLEPPAPPAVPQASETAPSPPPRPVTYRITGTRVAIGQDVTIADGFKVTGFEVDARKAAQINAGETYISDIDESVIEEAVKSGRLQATTNFDELQTCDAIIICVPTPLRKS